MEKDDEEIWLRDQEQNDDPNDVARTLIESGVRPEGRRLKAIFRRAMSGNGEYSQRLRAY